MHELAICAALFGTVAALAPPESTAVNRVRIRVGPLSGVEPALLARAWPLASAGGMASGSLLDIETGPVRVRCRSCGAESTVAANRLLCSACGEWRTDVVSGDELLLLSVEFNASPCEVANV